MGRIDEYLSYLRIGAALVDTEITVSDADLQHHIEKE